MTQLLYLDHAASTPLLPAAAEAFVRACSAWANPSSPHRAGRAARAALEDARERVRTALGWDGEVVFTSGASEALAIAIGRSRLPLAAVSAVEHEAVLRLAGDAVRLRVDALGRVDPAAAALGGLVAVQQVNSETGVIQPLAPIAAAVRGAGGLLLADCAQGAGKLSLPDADLVALSAHKFGGPAGIGALLVRDWSLIAPSGGQERGYRAGTEAMPLACAMAAALEAGVGCPEEEWREEGWPETGWLEEARRLRALLDRGIEAAGGEVVAGTGPRCPTIAAYVMPGVSSAAQVIRFDAAGIAVSAGSACSSGSMRPSHVMAAINAAGGGETVRVSLGRETREADVRRFLATWRQIAASAPGTSGVAA